MGFNEEAGAPGKILWIGGYSVLERPNVSMVSAVNAYVTVRVKSTSGNTILLDAPQLGLKAEGTIDIGTGKLNLKPPAPLLLLKTAAEVSLRYACANGRIPQGMQITTHNDDAFSYMITKGKIAKSGLGSSAALTVAAVRSVLKAYGVKNDNDTVHKLAQTAHALATGKVGSGFDIASASYGSILYTRYSPELVKALPSEYTNEQLLALIGKEWDYSAEKVSLPKEFRIVFANFVGESMITAKAIGSVSDFKAKNPKEYGALIKKINAENEKTINALREFSKETSRTFVESFNRARILTKQLGILSNVGIEPDDCTALIEESNRIGAFVTKLPGGGGKDAIAAICRSEEDEKKLRGFWSSRKDLKIIDLKAIL